MLTHSRGKNMNSLHETATITSKGQVTLPKAVRRALGVDAGSKLAFDLKGSQLVVSRVENPRHVDPAIAGFLTLLEKDIQTGKRLTTLPKSLANSMLATLRRPVNHDQEIAGDVAL